MQKETSVLAIRDFRLALAARLCDAFGMQMMSVVVAWQIYQMTRSPIALGLIGLAEGLPFMACALWAGHVVDRLEKRRIILIAEFGILAGGVGVTLLALSQKPPLFVFYLCLAWIGLCRSFLFPAQSVYVQMTVPREVFPKAAAWTTGVLHAATIGGPALGGLLYDLRGPKAAYACVVACFATSAILITRLSPMQPTAKPAEGSPAALEGFSSGVRFVLAQRVMLAAMSLDMFGVLFGGVDGVLPMFAVLLGAGPTGLGLLQAAPAAGALTCSLILAHRQPFEQTGKTFVSCVALFGLSIIAFACSRNFILSCVILAVGGAVDCVGMILRSSIYQALTPDRLRGRVSSVNGIFIRTSNEIGTFESGLAARLLGLVPSAVFGGCMTLVSVVAALWAAPELPGFKLGSLKS